MLQRGGRIRGQGTYGCVFQPPLLCRGKHVARDGSKVGKITMPQDAENELHIAKVLASIPDAKQYTLAPEPESCVPQPESKQADKDLGACEFVREAGTITKTIQLLMPWGGYPLSRLDLNPATFNFKAFMEQILAIGAFLVLNDLCHFDIWSQNFLFDTKAIPRLIDFGFTFRPSELDAEAVQFRWRQMATDHDTEAPEVVLMQGADKDMSPRDVADELASRKPAVQRLYALCGVDPREWADELYMWAESSKSFQQGDWLSCWKLYWPGFDAWSIGALLLDILEIQISAPTFMRGPVWTQHAEKIQATLRGLCSAHPASRLDAVEALSLLTDGSHPLVDSGQPEGAAGAAWIAAKQKYRPLV